MAPFPLCASPNPLTKAGNPLGGDTSFPAPLRARCARTSCPLRGYQQGGAGEKSLSVGQRAAPLSATGHWVSWERFGSTPQAGESRPRGSRSLPASPRPQNAGHTRPAPKKSAVRGGRGSTLQSFRKQHKENPESLVFYKGKGGGMCVFLLLLTLTACKLLHFFPLCYGMQGESKAGSSRSPSSRGGRQRAAEAAPLPAEPPGLSPARREAAGDGEPKLGRGTQRGRLVTAAGSTRLGLRARHRAQRGEGSPGGLRGPGGEG